MLERFYDPVSGDIEFDGVNLKKISLSNLRKSIGYVSQEPVLIIGKIIENLRYAKHDATDEEMRSALAMANATKFVNEMEDGLNTFVGSSALQNLSGG
jgi:ATP-binding cassette subfamily B (MDR/TAP) protein 1